MFAQLFYGLKEAKLPVTVREYLTLLEAMERGQVMYDTDGFYFLARTTLVKDERNLDRFDQVFGHVFKGLEKSSEHGKLDQKEIPKEWLRHMAEKHLSEEEKAEIEALGGWGKLMKTLKERLEEQGKRHQGGSKWIGTAGTSPFGAFGFNPEGVRIGQNNSRHRRAVKVWDKRLFKNLDDSVELGTRNIKVALKRLRRWARDGASEELDLNGTIRATAEHGYLDVKTRPERRNAIKLLLFLDVGGSMDGYIRSVEELFSAAKAEFKHLEYYYFHNCIYEGLWKDNARRHGEKISTLDIIHTFGSDYKVIIVGDAAMSPYEISHPGGAVEHWNSESGEQWMMRVLDKWPSSVWLNPVQKKAWRYTQSTQMVLNMMSGKMFPLNLSGISDAMKILGR